MLLGAFDAFWRGLKTPVGQDPVVLLMLIAGFVSAAMLVWGGPPALRLWRRRRASASA